MILSFRDKRTAAFARGERVAAFQSIEKQGHRRLNILDAATCVEDLRALPSNNLEMLQGDRRMHYSIRINRQWRVCFEWPEGDAGPSNVEIVDYH
jgi:proteic killer suppression protein